MDTGLTLLGALDALFFFGGILGALLLPGWRQRRHLEAARRQIALTEALDGEFGPIVAPVVKKPIWGPWRIEIVVPLGRPDTVGRILAIADAVFSAVGGIRPGQYQLILTAQHDSMRRTHGACAGRAAGAASLGHPSDRGLCWRISNSGY